MAKKKIKFESRQIDYVWTRANENETSFARTRITITF